MKELENKVEISSMIDEIAYNLDQKDVQNSIASFTEDAIISYVQDGKTLATLNGKAEIQEAVAGRFETISTLFHNNGTKHIRIMSIDQKAVAATSSIVKIITDTSTSDADVYYHDKLIKFNGLWYIVERTVDIITLSVH